MLIKSDVFDVADRLKEIDPNYTLHYSTSKKKYELRGKNGELLILFPYDAIDNRMIVHARRTRVERCAEIIREMDEINRKEQEKRQKELENDALDRLKEIAEKTYAKERT